MSRRRGEFEHRTSIFEGAFRAWSHLGGLDPRDLESKPATDLDPLTNPIMDDPRLTSKSGAKNLDGTPRHEYPYEPLPRSGLAHPYVQAILSPWLGPDADNEAIQLGLTTLRTWWQHRRKGESGSAIAALGTEKMKGVVEGYTRHFFTLAHCVVVNDTVQPPRGLHIKMKKLEKLRSTKKKVNQKQGPALPFNVGQVLTDPFLTPLEKLHAAQRQQLESAGGIASVDMSHQFMDKKVINMKGQCVPGKVDLPGVVDQVNRQAARMAHYGGGILPSEISSSAGGSLTYGGDSIYGDPNMTPVVFVSSNGDIQIAMKVDGITCAHCVKIVETVLRGCNGNKSPINGLLDAAADRDLSSVLIKIDKASNAKRIAFEAARNLSMVGYTAEPKEMSIVGADADSKAVADLGSLSTAFEVVANTDIQDVFDWTIPCTCPDNGVLRSDCSRHSQMNTRIFEAFKAREQQVTEYMAGCGMKYGMACTCGPSCRCKNCAVHNGGLNVQHSQQQQQLNHPSMATGTVPEDMFDEAAIHDQPLEFSNFGMGPPAAMAPTAPSVNPLPWNSNMQVSQPTAGAAAAAFSPNNNERQSGRASFRNPSVLSYGPRSSIRGMSITSETTFGRAMSGLSALSIDWENLDDFDLEVDHSEHINGNAPSGSGGSADDARRPSVRRSILSTGSQDSQHVSFKV